MKFGQVIAIPRWLVSFEASGPLHARALEFYGKPWNFREGDSRYALVLPRLPEETTLPARFDFGARRLKYPRAGKRHRFFI